MFLDVLRRRNPSLIEHAIALHQAGKLPANAYVIDLDAVEDNARAIAGAAEKLGLTTLAMTKQMGRNRSFCRAVKRGGIPKAVAVDMECARAAHRAGLEIGHIGHLSQVPKYEAEAAAALAPDYWTVFNFEKANEAGRRLAEAQARAATFWLVSGRRATRSIAVMKADFRPRRSSLSPRRWIGRPADDLPASRPSRRCCSTRPPEK